MGWQKSSGYNQRSQVEAQMGRWKMVIGPKLKGKDPRQPANRGRHRCQYLEPNDQARPRAEFERVA
jgi:hypothetical protein